MLNPTDIQSRMGELYALLAGITSLAVWRINVLPQKLMEWRALGRLVAAGLGQRWVVRLLWMVRVEVVVLIVGLVCWIASVISAVHVFRLLHILLGEQGMDVELMHRVFIHAGECKVVATEYGLASIGCVVVQWLLLMCPRPSLPGDLIAGKAHPFVVPREYRGSELALWEYRVSQCDNLAGEAGDSWRQEWSAWSGRVVDYHDQVKPVG